MSSRSVAFLTGPSDLMVFLAGLQHLGESLAPWAVVLTGRNSNIPEAMVDTCRSMAQGAPVFFIDFDDPTAVPALLDQLGRDFDSVAITHLMGAEEEELLAELRWQRLILTENGIATHLLPANRARRLNRRTGRPRFAPDLAFLPLSGHPLLGCPPYLRRLPALKLLGHDPEAYGQVRASLTRNSGLAPIAARIAAAASCAVVAGTSLSRAKLLSPEAEARAYRTVLKRLARQGHDLVVWKPHPRLDCDIGKLAHLVTVHDFLPLELLLPFGSPSVTVWSTASSCLLTARLWHGLQSRRIPVAMASARHPHVAFLQQVISPGPNQTDLRGDDAPST